MESRRLVIVLAALVTVLAATVVVLAADHKSGGSATRVGSGAAVSVARATGPFGGVDLRGTGAVLVRVGPKTSVVVRGDDNIVPLIHTTVVSGTLVISDRGSYRTSTPLTITVETPTLTNAALDGTGRLDLQGATSSLDLRLAGTGILDARNLTAQTVRALMAGTGTIHVRARRALDANVEGTGSIVYHGRPAHLRAHVSGTGSIAAAS